MKNILVIGGAGYIGSHLIEELIIQNKGNIFSLDNYSSGSEQNHIDGCKYYRGEASNISDIINQKIDLVLSCKISMHLFSTCFFDRLPDKFRNFNSSFFDGVFNR